MSHSRMSFSTSWRNLLREITLGAIGLPVVVTGFMILTQGIESWIVAVPVGVFFGVIAFLYYARRFHQRGLESVEFDDQGITAQARSGHLHRLEWARAKVADHGSSNGLRWEFSSAEEDSHLVLRDDGFSVTQWDKICGVIRRHLDAHGVPYSSEGFAKAFDDEDTTDDGG